MWWILYKYSVRVHYFLLCVNVFWLFNYNNINLDTLTYITRVKHTKRTEIESKKDIKTCLPRMTSWRRPWAPCCTWRCRPRRRACRGRRAPPRGSRRASDPSSSSAIRSCWTECPETTPVGMYDEADEELVASLVDITHHTYKVTPLCRCALCL